MKTLKDVIEEITHKLKVTEEARSLIGIGADVGQQIISANNPVGGVVVTGIKDMLVNLDVFKLRCLLVGLSKGINQEKQINELYNFVKTNSKRAFLVGNVIKQAMAAESVKVCVIYGLILANYIENDSISDEDMVICCALNNASDVDLANFLLLLEEHVSKSSDGIRRVVLSEDNVELQSTCSWAIYNRIFTLTNPRMKGENWNVDYTPRVSSKADRLLTYIRKAQQILKYS